MSLRTPSVIILLLSPGMFSMIPIMNVYAQMPVVNHTNVIVDTPSKFSLWEGVDVAIENLVNTGTALSVENVLRELEEMKSRKEVPLRIFCRKPRMFVANVW